MALVQAAGLSEDKFAFAAEPVRWWPLVFTSWNMTSNNEPRGVVLCDVWCSDVRCALEYDSLSARVMPFDTCSVCGALCCVVMMCGLCVLCCLVCFAEKCALLLCVLCRVAFSAVRSSAANHTSVALMDRFGDGVPSTGDDATGHPPVGGVFLCLSTT